MAKSYLFHHTNKNSATPCVVHKKMLSLMASVCAFFASTKVVPVFYFAALQSKLSTSSLAQLAVGSRRYISPSFLPKGFGIHSGSFHLPHTQGKISLNSFYLFVFPSLAQGCFSFRFLNNVIKLRSTVVYLWDDMH